MSDSERERARRAARLPRVFPDRPVVEGELEFEFDGFARMLAGLAWNPENGTPFTVVVRGGWGRGKTTLLRRAQWMLEHPGEKSSSAPAGVRTVRTVWFNAWKYPDDDTVLAGLLGAAIDRLQKGGMLEQLRLLVDSYKSDTLKGLFGLAAPAPVRDVILGDGSGGKYEVVREKRAFHDTFRDLFSQVSRLLFETAPAFRDQGGLPEERLWNEETQRRQVLAVFLDDLDRCRRERVVEVLEAINLFLDLPGVCFYLGLDWERLVDVLPETVKDQGDEFLEKVVQVAFDLPEVSPTDAEDYVAGLLAGTDLEAVLGGDGGGRSEDIRVLAKALETRHPRHVKRFLNDLSMTLAALEHTGKLGEGEDQLPEPAVVSWHLLSEILPRERWREVRALPANLMAFLRESERLEKEAAEGDGAEEREAPDEWRRIEASGLAERHLKILRELSDRQRHLLIYFATPPAIEAAKSRRTTGRRNLFDLDSAAWAEIPGGSFWMGAQKEDREAPGYDPEAEDRESPVRRVTVSPFRLARYPVTNSEYAEFVEDTDATPPAHWEGGRIPEGKQQHPVVNVSWYDAEVFCAWLSDRVSKEGERRTVRLPTEAEWEFAARSGERRRYPWGNQRPEEHLANFGMNVGDTTPVGTYPDGATPEGVHDLAGNVREWCADWYGRYPDEEEKDPTGPESGGSLVLRGGSFFHGPWSLRGAYRSDDLAEDRLDIFGFRVLRSSSRGVD